MIKRITYLSKVESFINQPLVKVLIGVRRSGKTVLLSQIKDLLIEKGADENNIVQINFESMKYRKLTNDKELYNYICSFANGKNGKLYVMLDEIQEVQNWQRVIASLRVDFDCDIYITGSNSKLLSGELATYLSGRYVLIKVFPFMLSEVKELMLQQGTYQSDEKVFTEYLKYGGFPQRCLLSDEHSIETYLRDIYDAIVVRDIENRHNIKDSSVMKKILAFLLDNIGNPFSARKISGMMTSQGVKVATTTVLNYVDYFKEAFILFSVNRYDIKGKNLLATTEKYYAVDLGLRNIIKKSEVIDSSKLYENIVYLEMLSRGYEVQIGKLDNNEIDFICYKGNEKIYIQVAYLITPSDEEREFGNLEKISDNYPKYVISGDLVDLSRSGIIHKNIIQFLLEK